MKRNIKYIAVHCTAGSQQQTADDLMREFRRKGWRNPGYHYLVTADGMIHRLLDVAEISNGVRGYNSITVNVAYTGGIDAKGRPCDNRTDEQKWALRLLLKGLREKFPKAVIQGHRDFSPDLNRNGRIEPNEYIKACPCFDAKQEYKDI